MADRVREQISRRQSLDARIRKEARRRGIAADSVRKQYVFTLFLKRFFTSAAGERSWLLLGGSALLIRTGGGRFTQDIDLARAEDWTDPDELRAEIMRRVGRGPDEFDFSFVVRSVRPHREPDAFGYGARTAKARVLVMLYGRQFDDFSIDITAQRHTASPIDEVPLVCPVDDPSVVDLPCVPTVPVENHLADKICALYETHRNGPSTRYRDLADIVRIVQKLPFSAARLVEVLTHECGRRRMTRPVSMHSPDPSWAARYPGASATFAEFPEELRRLDASLAMAAACLDEVLDGTRTTGSWDPENAVWQDGNDDRSAHVPPPVQ